MIFHPVAVVEAAVVSVAAAPHLWSLAVRCWGWLRKFFSKSEKPAAPWSLVASIRRVLPNGGWFEFCFSWQKGCAPPQTPTAPAICQPVNQIGAPASSAPPQLDVSSNSDPAPVSASLLPIIVGN